MTVLISGRVAAERLMTDTCTVTRPGEPVFNETTGTYTPTSTTIYTGKCRVQAANTLAGGPNAGERVVVISRFTVSLPISAPVVQVDDIVTVTIGTFDAQLIGKRFRVASLHHKSHATARRLEVEETQS